MTQPTVFISYSHKDEVEKEALLAHLSALQVASDLIDPWTDDRIGAGEDWLQKVEEAMAQAKVAILLVSANFLGSRFIKNREVLALLQRRKNEGLIVFPVIAKACPWEKVDWLAEMQVRPKNGEPVWREGGIHVDADLKAIVTEIAELLTIDTFLPPSPELIPFTNREDEIDLVLSSFAPAYFILDGPAGYGKTELLRQLEKRFTEKNWRCAYASVAEHDMLPNLVTALANEFGVALIKDPGLPWQSRLGGSLKKRWENEPVEGGLVLLIDLEKKPALPIVRELLEDCVPAIQNNLRTLEFFEKNHNRFRVILAGRHLAASEEVRSALIELRVLPLAPFDYHVVRNTVRRYLRGHAEDSIRQLAAHLMYLTGGHPGCVAQVLEMYRRKGLSPDDFLEFFSERIWENVVRQVANSVYNEIPEDVKGLHKMLDALSIFRYLDYAILRNLVEQNTISEVDDEYDLASTLTTTYLFTQKGRFLRDDITRRLLAIRLWHERPDQFPMFCLKAQDMCVTRLRDPNVTRPEVWVIEYLFQLLQQRANDILDKDQRGSINVTFLSEDVPKALQMLVERVSPRERRGEQYALYQAMDEDWEFRFTVNYYLRDAQYSDEPYEELRCQIDRFFAQGI